MTERKEYNITELMLLGIAMIFLNKSYYAKSGGWYYHTTPFCRLIRALFRVYGYRLITVERVLKDGLRPCPYCVGEAK